jgi:hypothetical protein
MMVTRRDTCFCERTLLDRAGDHTLRRAAQYRQHQKQRDYDAPARHLTES